jgi:NifU-like protein involved in Fe-S cluster formation
MDHFHSPRNEGELAGANARGESSYPPCGDHLVLELRLAEGRVAEAGYRCRGCGVVLAAASAGTELILGRPVAEARTLTAFELDEALGQVPPPKRHALLLFLDCLAQALGARGGTP